MQAWQTKVKREKSRQPTKGENDQVVVKCPTRSGRGLINTSDTYTNRWGMMVGLGSMMDGQKPHRDR
jgi:hypothetical protein